MVIDHPHVGSAARAGCLVALDQVCITGPTQLPTLAAQSLATQRLEQTRAAKWDPRASPAVDEVVLTNFPTVPTNILDMPVSGTNVAYATNFTMITNVSSGGYPLKMIRVDCVWSFRQRMFSNTVATYRAPDQ